MRCPDCKISKRCRKHSFMVQVHDAKVYWAYDLNDKDPYSLAPRSKGRAWFRCPSWKNCGHHVWQAQLSRFTAGTRCPYCANRKLCDCTVAWLNVPNIQLYWDFDTNTVLPTSISCRSQRTYAFKCVCGHKWSCGLPTFIKNPNCPYCQ